MLPATIKESSRAQATDSTRPGTCEEQGGKQARASKEPTVRNQANKRAQPSSLPSFDPALTLLPVARAGELDEVVLKGEEPHAAILAAGLPRGLAWGWGDG